MEGVREEIPLKEDFGGNEMIWDLTYVLTIFDLTYVQKELIKAFFDELHFCNEVNGYVVNSYCDVCHAFKEIVDIPLIVMYN